MPNTSAATAAIAAVKASTIGSIETSEMRGRLGGAMSSRRLIPSFARPSPTMAPHPASTRLSASICTINARREPPSAERTASSRSRDEARTSSRLATLAHAMSSTNMTAPMSARIAGRTLFTMPSDMGSAYHTVFDVFLMGKRDWRSAVRSASCAFAVLSVAPGLSRPTARYTGLIREAVL